MKIDIIVPKRPVNSVELPEGVLVVVCGDTPFLRVRMGGTIYGPSSDGKWQAQANGKQRYSSFLPVESVRTAVGDKA